MTLGAWRRWDSPPTVAEMAVGITEDRRPLWLALTRWLHDTYDLDGELTWADEDSGWVLRYRRNGRALTTLSPSTAGGFGALVVVGPSVLDAALAAPLSETTRETLRFATAYADGRWLWLKVMDPAIVDDVKTLILLKAAPPAHQGRPRRRVLVSAG
jgi:Protein of unknown function (DUF3788)